MLRFQLVSTVLFIGLFVSSCASGTVDGIPATEMVDRIENTATSIDSDARYVNREGGFSLVLPQEWQVVGPIPISQDGFTYNSYDLGLDPAASGGPGTSHIIIADEAVLSFEEFIRLQCSTCPEHPFEPIQIGEFPAIRTQIGGGDVPIMVEWTFIEKDGHLLGFSLHDPETLEPLDAILQTLVFE